MGNKKIFVGGLAYSVGEDDLREVFSQFGEIDSINIITDRETGLSRGFGFIEFSSAEQAKNALAKDGFQLQGRRLGVNLAKEKGRSGRGGMQGQEGHGNR